MKARLQDLIGNPRAYAVQHKDGSWHPIRKPVNAAVLNSHKQMAQTVGTYVLDGNKARTLVFDIDMPPLAQEMDDKLMADTSGFGFKLPGNPALVEATKLRDALVDLGIPEVGVGLEYSGRKGYHVWVVFGRKVEAAKLRRLGRAVLGLAQVKCEVFPKQDESRDLGNLVKLPEGVHQVTERKNPWVIQPDIVSVQVLDDILAELPEEPKRGATFHGEGESPYPCLEKIQEGVEKGGRNNALFHLATMLRRQGLSPENVDLVIRNTYAKMDQTDFPEVEVDTLLESSCHSGPLCNSLDEDLHCGELCMFNRTKGLKVRPGALKNVKPGEGVVVVLTDREGKKVDISHPDAVGGVVTLS